MTWIEPIPQPTLQQFLEAMDIAAETGDLESALRFSVEIRKLLDHQAFGQN